MREYMKFYIDGQWVDPVTPKTLDVINPATEEVAGHISAGSAADVDKAVKAARKAFETYSQTTPRRAHRPARSASWPNTRSASATSPRPSPRRWARPPASPSAPRPPIGMAHLADRHRGAEELQVRGRPRHDAHRQGADRRLRHDHALELADQPDRLQGRPGARHRLHHGAEAVGRGAVLGLHLGRGAWTPPACRPASSTWSTAPAPKSARRSPAIPGIDMVSFTGSTRAGIEVAKAAATDGQARRAGAGRQEPEHHPRRRRHADRRRRRRPLGDAATPASPAMRRPACWCRPRRWTRRSSSPRRPPKPTTVGDPNGNATIGPVVNKTQWDKIQRLIKAGIEEGATLVTGGPGRPDGLDKGYLRQADRLRQRHQRHDHRQGRDLRPGGLDPRLRHRSTGGQDRQRHRVRPGGLHLGHGPGQGPRRGLAAARRPGVDQRRRRRHDAPRSAATR